MFAGGTFTILGKIDDALSSASACFTRRAASELGPEAAALENAVNAEMAKGNIPRLVDDAASAANSTAWSAPGGWRLPTNNGNWTGTPGNSTWRSDIPEVNQMTGNRAIQFREGYIDLSPYKITNYKSNNLNGTNADFALADAQLAIDLQLNSANAARVWRSQNKLTWHHHQDAQTLELVPTVLNDVPHQGGATILRR